MGFIRLSQQTVIISLRKNCIDWQILVMETCGVFFEVQTGFLNTSYTRFVIQSAKYPNEVGVKSGLFLKYCNRRVTLIGYSRQQQRIDCLDVALATLVSF
jgi:hypothetical protein